MQVPTRLEDWNLEIIFGLLRAGAQEELMFDFKDRLPHKKSEQEKLRLRKVVTSFANGLGGYLIFGVADSGPPESRLVGVDDEEFVTNLSRLLGSQHLTPPVALEPRNPPISLEGGRFVHVIRVPPSPYLRPHAVRKSDGQLTFSRRTPGATEHMSYGELQLLFERRHEQLSAIRQLLEELRTIQEDAEVVRQSSQPHHHAGFATPAPVQHAPHPVDATGIQPLTARAFGLLHDQLGTLGRLRAVRRHARQFNHLQNDARESFLGRIPTPFGLEEQKEAFRQTAVQGAARLIDSIGGAIRDLEALLRRIDPQ